MAEYDRCADRAGVDGVFAGGSKASSFRSTWKSDLVAMRFCRQAAADRVPLYANVGCVTTRETVKLALAAAGGTGRRRGGRGHAVVSCGRTQENWLEHYTRGVPGRAAPGDGVQLPACTAASNCCPKPWRGSRRSVKTWPA